MSVQVKAVYENGVFRPLQSVELPERQQVTVTISGNADGTDQVLFVLPDDRWQTFCDALDQPPREILALRKLLTEASVLDGNNAAAQRASPA
jgi:predicted DNA-binding antitoxin AbrB/MazE fold protein